ncbi:hypothetical protein Cgig2_029394 [Carnegiea gigantea]|uniref:Protein kinase domain-containing protein n=1 Tax=Carnegiea gigantea TaxID=171969 RepID=A0A9Q1KWT0_9CARY|nr:hypothetical protein Cgig2_029394 [Carnegiea gigantea]
MSLFLIMEYVSENLHQFIQLQKYGPTDVKKWLREMLSAVAYLHDRNIIHRDLKPENILVNPDSKELKLADFGLARGWFKDIQLTPQVTTLRYRAPEVLLGCEKYTCAIDMWSIGCIFAELADFVFPFRGVSDSPSDPGSIEEIIHNIFQKLGTPTEASWPGVSSFLNFPDVIPMHTAETNDISQHLDADGNDLLRVSSGRLARNY